MWGALVIGEIEIEEWVVIVIPLTMGFQILSLAVLSLVFGPGWKTGIEGEVREEGHGGEDLVGRVE